MSHVKKNRFLPMRKQRRRSASQLQLISAFVFATRIVQFLFFLNFKLLAIFYSCTGQFVSDLVGNPEDRFSRVAAHISSTSRVLCMPCKAHINFSTHDIKSLQTLFPILAKHNEGQMHSMSLLDKT